MDSLIITVFFQVFQSVHSKVIPTSQEKETGMTKDVEDFGRIVLKLLKWFQDAQKKVPSTAERY